MRIRNILSAALAAALLLSLLAACGQGWSFVDEAYVGSPDLDRRFHTQDRNTSHLSMTEQVTRYTNGPRGAVTGGLPASELQDAIHPLTRLQIRDVHRPPQPGVERIERDLLKIYRPRVKPAPGGTKPPAARRDGHRGRGSQHRP